MNDNYIAVIDSGVGGLSVLSELVKSAPNNNYIYFGDNSNAPYGNKSERKLKEITIKNLDLLLSYNLKAIVLACNTLSVTLLSFVEGYSGLPTFGVFPPVEKYLMKGERVLLLSTMLTSKKFMPSERLHVLGLKRLALDLEYNKFNARAIDLQSNLLDSVGYFVNKKGYYDRVVLGCTHYEFIKNKIYDHFCPRKISSGIEFTTKNVKNFLSSDKSLVKHKENQVLFVGDTAQENKNFWVCSGREW